MSLHLLLAVLITSTVLVSTPALSAGKKKSKASTQLFEQETEGSSVSGKVKVVREIQEETEVFIDNPQGSSGPFVLPAAIKDRAKLMKILNSSQKHGGDTVVINIDAQQRITGVEASSAESKPQEP